VNSVVAFLEWPSTSLSQSGHYHRSVRNGAAFPNVRFNESWRIGSFSRLWVWQDDGCNKTKATKEYAEKKPRRFTELRPCDSVAVSV